MKNKILFTINYIMAIVFALSILCETNTNIDVFAGIVSASYLMLFAYANKERYMH